MEGIRGAPIVLLMMLAVLSAVIAVAMRAPIQPSYYASCTDTGQNCVAPEACFGAEANAWVSSLDGVWGSGSSYTWGDCIGSMCPLVCPVSAFKHVHCTGNICYSIITQYGMSWSKYWPAAYLYISATVYEYCGKVSASAIAFCTGECGT